MADGQKNESQENQAGEQKNKKIRYMSLMELNSAIEKTEKNQGSLNSKYAKELLKQKKHLTK